MSDVVAARWQMAVSLGFHIVFAVAGIAMPVLMALAEWRWLRTGDTTFRLLAQHWAKGTAILFAVGAVSGTALSFELGLLWPRFMAFAGPIFGLPFAFEGFAFFLEAIFLGIYLYGWDRVPPRAHLFAGVMVAISGVLSGAFVVLANGWMNAPTGFRLVGARAVDVDPVAAMWNAAGPIEAVHMTLAAFEAVGFAVAGVHAFFLLRDRSNLFHRHALHLSLAMGAVAALLQPLSGDVSARDVAQRQPEKLAALEGQWETERGAPLRIGGWPDAEREETRYALLIPKMLSVLAFHDPAAEVRGLKAFPRDERPPVHVVHLAFQVMVGAGTVLAGVAAAAGVLRWRGVDIAADPRFLKLLVAVAPLGLVALEAGWTVTEVGRQPWIVYRVMRTAEAVTPLSPLWVSLLLFTVLYAFLGFVVLFLLRRQFLKSPQIVAPSQGRERPS